MGCCFQVQHFAQKTVQQVFLHPYITYISTNFGIWLLWTLLNWVFTKLAKSTISVSLENQTSGAERPVLLSQVDIHFVLNCRSAANRCCSNVTGSCFVVIDELLVRFEKWTFSAQFESARVRFCRTSSVFLSLFLPFYAFLPALNVTVFCFKEGHGW